MYTFNQVQNVDFTEFDILFMLSEPLIHSRVWELFKVTELSATERLEHFRSLINDWIQNKYLLGVYVEKDGLPIKFDVGNTRIINEKRYLYTNLTFNGETPDGSRSWLHSQEYIEAAVDYYKTLGFSGRVFPLKTYEHMYTHLKSITSDKFYYTEEPQEGSDVILYLHYS